MPQCAPNAAMTRMTKMIIAFPIEASFLKILKNMGMNDISGLFYVNKASDLDNWSPKVRLASRKSYMQGYYKLDDPNIRSIHRFFASCEHEYRCGYQC